jgi:hypothetical protein
VWKIQLHVHNHVATLRHFFKRAARKAGPENEAAPAQGFVLNIHKIQFDPLRGSGRGSGPTAARYVDDLSVKVGLYPAEFPISLFDLHENLTSNQVLEHTPGKGNARICTPRPEDSEGTV